MAGMFARTPKEFVEDSAEARMLLELRDRLDRSVALVDAALGARTASPAELKNWLLDVRNVLRPPGSA
jgi:hypothetical protein